jgi:hypothetical protein
VLKIFTALTLCIKNYKPLSSLVYFENSSTLKNFSANYNTGAVVVISEVVGLGPGVDVMMTIFCDFPQFSAKKLAFFFNTNVMIMYGFSYFDLF